MRSLGTAAVADAGAERVYMMGFGEKWSHFHFMVMSRVASVAEEFRSAALLAQAPELRSATNAFRMDRKSGGVRQQGSASELLSHGRHAAHHHEVEVRPFLAESHHVDALGAASATAAVPRLRISGPRVAAS